MLQQQRGNVKHDDEHDYFHLLLVELKHDDMKVLEKASAEVAQAMRPYPGVWDVDDGYQPGKAQLDLELTPKAAVLGLAKSVARDFVESHGGSARTNRIASLLEHGLVARADCSGKMTPEAAMATFDTAPRQNDANLPHNLKGSPVL